MTKREHPCVIVLVSRGISTGPGDFFEGKKASVKKNRSPSVLPCESTTSTTDGSKSFIRVYKYYCMPAPIVGRKFGVGDIAPPDREKIKGIKVAGISGSSRQQAGMSK